ncbi:MAG: hypothetical protein JXK16_12860 [Thiotrichales bacterium]|nr:hypothetical protein [Thiotrichales bacterium]
MADINKEQDDKATQEMLEMMGELPTEDFDGADIEDLLSALDEASASENETSLDVSDAASEIDMGDLDDIESLMASLEDDGLNDELETKDIDLPESSSVEDSIDLDDLNLDDMGDFNIDDMDLDLDDLDSELTAETNESTTTSKPESVTDAEAVTSDETEALPNIEEVNLDDLEDIDAMLAGMELSEDSDLDKETSLDELDLDDLNLDEMEIDNVVDPESTDESILDETESPLAEQALPDFEETTLDPSADSHMESLDTEVSIDLDELANSTEDDDMDTSLSDELENDASDEIDDLVDLEGLEALEESETELQQAEPNNESEMAETVLDETISTVAPEPTDEELTSNPPMNSETLKTEAHSKVAPSNQDSDSNDSEVVEQAAQSIETMEEAIGIDQEIQAIASEVSQTAKEATLLAMATTQQAHASAERTQKAIEATFAAAERAFEAAKNAGYSLELDGLDSALSSEEINQQLASIKAKNEKLQAVNLSIKTRISEMKPH